MLTLFIYVPNDNVELKQFYLNRAKEIGRASCRERV